MKTTKTVHEEPKKVIHGSEPPRFPTEEELEQMPDPPTKKVIPQTSAQAKKLIKNGTPESTPKKPTPPKKGAEKTELGHVIGSQAGDIDEFVTDMKKPMTLKEIAEKMKLTTGRVKSHVLHLINDKKVKFEVKDDKYLMK